MTTPLPVDMDNDAPQPLPSTPLADLIGVRPPWAWSNLTVEDAGILDGMLAVWVADYNTNHATDIRHVIPACWRQHPALVHQVPVLFWAWWEAHRNPEATILFAVAFYEKHLPAFQERLGDLLGPGGVAQKCRLGRHEDHPAADSPRLTDAARANTADADARGPSVVDVLVNTTFGAAVSVP